MTGDDKEFFSQFQKNKLSFGFLKHLPFLVDAMESATFYPKKNRKLVKTW